MAFNISFYKNKKVLVTGHTGFKGTWMCQALLMAGANVCGYSLLPPTEPSLFDLIGLNMSLCPEKLLKAHDGVKPEMEDKATEAVSKAFALTAKILNGQLTTVIGDITDLSRLQTTFEKFKPEIVIHMAAQPIVRESYKNPVRTYATNVMGTVNVLECVRNCKSVKSFVNVTTDKVYLNKEWQWGYRENEELNGYDPYSNSKSCSELVTSSYVNSFFNEEIKAGRHIAITTMRAGNVIGGGDFAADRIIPDCVRAITKGESINVRNPYSTRPYQHVLEPVMAYLMVAARQYADITYAGCYNVGPDDNGALATGKLVKLFCDAWNKVVDMGFEDSSAAVLHKIDWHKKADAYAPHEANYLKLDCTKIKKTFDWEPVWTIETAIGKIAEWTRVYLTGGDVALCMCRQIEEYIEG